MSDRDPLDAFAGVPAPPPLGAALEAELAGLAPVPPRRPLRQVAVIVLASIGWAFAMAGLLTIRRDLFDLPRLWLVLYLVAWLLGFVLPIAALVVPRPGSMMPRWPTAAAIGGLASVGFVIAGLTVARRAPTSLDHGLGYGHLCLSTGLVTALVPVLLAVIALRGAIPSASRISAAALGAAAGCAGGFMLHLHCPIADGVHVGVVHGGVVVASAALSALLAPRWLSGR